MSWKSAETDWTLYLGGRAVSEDLTLLRKLGVGLVINSTNNLATPAWLPDGRPSAASAARGTPAWMRVPLWHRMYPESGANLVERFADLFGHAWTLVAAGCLIIFPPERTQREGGREVGSPGRGGEGGTALLWNRWEGGRDCAALEQMGRSLESCDPAAQVSRCIQHGTNVLVHCRSGAHRSATLCAMILVKFARDTPEAVIRLIRKRRPVIQIDGGNRLLLERLHEQLEDQQSMTTALAVREPQEEAAHDEEVEMLRDEEPPAIMDDPSASSAAPAAEGADKRRVPFWDAVQRMAVMSWNPGRGCRALSQVVDGRGYHLVILQEAPASVDLDSDRWSVATDASNQLVAARVPATVTKVCSSVDAPGFPFRGNQHFQKDRGDQAHGPSRLLQPLSLPVPAGRG